MSRQDEFYIGYAGGIPDRMRRSVRRAAIIAMGAGLAAACVFVSEQRQLADSRFEFGHVRTFTGYLALEPTPVLMVPEGGDTALHWLVAPGKFGAAAALGGTTNGWITLRGTLIAREAWRMIEVQPGSVRADRFAMPAPAASAPRGRLVVLHGEIVDSKCFLGVMNPGERTVHRDCAMRCLSGGIPAMFAYRDEAGSHLALLLGATAASLREGVGGAITLQGMLSGAEDSLVFDIGGH
jgi:hypothetical protein